MKKENLKMIILYAILVLFIVEIVTGLVSYALGTIIIAISDVIFKIGLHLKYTV